MTRHFVSFAVLAVLVGGLAGSPSRGQESFSNLTSRIPDTANTILIFNVEKIHQSPLAKQQNWREKHENAFASGVTVLPPEASKFVMASQLDFEFVQPIWEVYLADLKYDASMAKVAAKHGGSVDRIEDRDAAVLPEDTYVVKFGPRFVGAMSPGNRQNVSRWVSSIYSKSLGPLSAYLKEAVGFSEQVGTPIVMAMDLTHALSKETVRPRLAAMKAVQGKQVDLDALSELIASIRGVTLGITITDKPFGKIKVDFAQDATPLGDLAKPLLLEVLANQGAMIDEFADWTAKVEGNRISIEGNLYRSGMQRILSVLDAPPSLHHEEGTAASPGQTEADLQRLASQQYFKTVSGYVDDLRAKRGSDQFVTNGQVGLWFERYARKIDDLSVLNVDDELVAYGSFVSSSLREAETAMKRIGGQTRVREVNQQPVYNVQTWGAAGVDRWGRYGAYGGWRAYEDVRAEQRERTKIKTEERVGGNMTANDIMREVQSATGEVRRSMTKKFNVDF